MSWLIPGTILHGRKYEYKIVRTIGEGAFGITYLASVRISGALGSLDTEILVAIKEFFMHGINGREENNVTASNKDGVFGYYKAQFVHEAENLSRLDNQGIVKVIESFEENQTVYYVMEYISNGTLDDKISLRRGMSPAECIAYAKKIANVLDYMHQNMMLHLDLKPSNIMIRDNNDVVLIDFGLSRRYDIDDRPETIPIITFGTMGFVPIEQFYYRKESHGKFPATIDIYALGAIMYKMLIGRRPPVACDILNDGFPCSEFINRNVPLPLVEVVVKCMQPLEKKRYQSIKAVIDALNSICPDGHDMVSEISETNQSDGDSDFSLEPTLSPMPFRDGTNKIIISFKSQSPWFWGYEIKVTQDRTSFRANKGHIMLEGTELEIDCDIFSKVANEIRSWPFAPKGREYDFFNSREYSEVPGQFTVLLHESQSAPYLILNCVSIGGDLYGNLHGFYGDFGKRISSLIPDFDELIKQSLSGIDDDVNSYQYD